MLKYYRLKEVAALLGVHYQTAFRYAKENQFPTLRIGHLILVPKAYFDALSNPVRREGV